MASTSSVPSQGANVQFDFESFIPKLLPELENVDTESLINPFGSFRGDPKHRTVVCTHWLLGLCQNGEKCSFLHRLERSKMPACRHGILCKIKNCPKRHVEDQEVVECVFFKQGFCYNGPNCVRRHVKRLPDEIPKEANFDQCIVVNRGGGADSSAPVKKKRAGPNENYKVSLCDHWLLRGTCHFNEGCIFAHGEEELLDGFQSEQLNDNDVFDPTRFRLDAPLVLPFVKQARIAYFLFQAPDLRSLLVSRRRQVWSVSAKLASDINMSLRSYDHVVAYMLVRPLKGVYGVVRIAGPIVPGPAPHPALTPEFPVTWLRSMRVSLRTLAQLKIGTTGVFVGRTVSDAKFESKVGSEIMYIAYRKPEWDWSNPEQFQLAEESLLRLRIAAGEPLAPPLLSPDALFPLDWPDRMPFAFDRPAGGVSSTSTTGGSGPASFSSSNAAAQPAVQSDFYTLDFPGFMFNASGEVANEVFSRSMFGLPANMKDVTISPQSPLFMLDPARRSILGLFQARTPLAHNLDPSAFVNWADPINRHNPQAAVSSLPWQVSFSVVVECPPVFIDDPDVLNVFGDRGQAGVPLGGPLSLKETKALANLFAVRAGVMPSQRPVRGPGSTNTYVYKPPHPFVDVVYIDIQASPFDIKKRVLGVSGSFIKDIVNMAGGQQKLRIRMRGIGSNYIEGSQELQEPLHFNISAETNDILQMAVGCVRELVRKAKAELEFQHFS